MKSENYRTERREMLSIGNCHRNRIMGFSGYNRGIFVSNLFQMSRCNSAGKGTRINQSKQWIWQEVEKEWKKGYNWRGLPSFSNCPVVDMAVASHFVLRLDDHIDETCDQMRYRFIVKWEMLQQLFLVASTLVIFDCPSATVVARTAAVWKVKGLHQLLDLGFGSQFEWCWLYVFMKLPRFGH